jgi:hypothetical protein
MSPSLLGDGQGGHGGGKQDDAVDNAPSLHEGDTARVIDHQAERKLCRKFDVRILPVLAVMCKWQR